MFMLRKYGNFISESSIIYFNMKYYDTNCIYVLKLI
jgi:hypothetical protein